MRNSPLFVFSLLFLTASGMSDDFTQFRGNSGNGVTEDSRLPESWSAESGLKWKVRNPGAGWSQPVIWKDRVYLTGAVAEQDIRPANFADGVKSPQSMGVSLFAKAPDVVMQWKLFCLNLNDGGVLWEQTISEGKPKFPIHPSNSWATETPCVDENGVCVYFGAAGVVAGISHDGTLRWTKDIGVFKTSNGFGTGSSLAGFSGMIFVQNFNEQSAVVYGIDGKTGQEKWKYERPEALTSWSTPLIWRNELRAELIVSGGEQIESLDPITGNVFWTLRQVKAATACSPACDRKQLYFGGSDPFSKGPLFAVKPGAEGDIAPEKKNEKFEACAWLQERQGPGMASPVSSGEYIYSTENNILKCFRASDGERLYQTRLPGLDMVAACPIMVGNSVFVIDENGKSLIVEVGPEFKVIGKGEIGETVWATPATANGALIIRGVDSLFCIAAK